MHPPEDSDLAGWSHDQGEEQRTPSHPPEGTGKEMGRVYPFCGSFKGDKGSDGQGVMIPMYPALS